MSSEGGQPRQLTFYQGSAQPLNDRMGIHNEVLTWTPDSKRILFLSRRRKRGHRAVHRQPAGNAGLLQGVFEALHADAG